MASNKNQRGRFRTKNQKERDRQFIAALYVKNYGLREIADKLYEYVQEEGDDYRLSPQQIFYDVKRLLIEWKKTRLQLVDDYIELELKKLDRMENELWKAWESSKAAKRKTKLEGGEINGGAVTGGTLKERILEETTGDARYLDLIMDIMDRRAKLLGYDKPTKIEITKPTDEPEKKERNLESIPESIVTQMSDYLLDIDRTVLSKN